MSFLRFAATSFFIAAMATASHAQAADALSKEDVTKIVKDTLLEDPEIIMNALEKLRTQKAEQAQKDAIANIEKNKEEIFNSKDSPFIGPANADVTIVEFFDYHCGYCKHFLPTLTKYMQEDKKVRVVFKEMPILSDDSVTASKAALAVHNIDSDKYFAFHNELMTAKGKFDEARLLEIGKKIGIDTAKLKAEMNKKEVSDALDKNRALAQQLGVRGTPAVIIGNRVFPGAMPYEELKKAVQEQRAGN